MKIFKLIKRLFLRIKKPNQPTEESCKKKEMELGSRVGEGILNEVVDKKKFKVKKK